MSKISDSSHPVDYSKSETPTTYRCGHCGAKGCKLWRLYQTSLDHQTLLCADCAALNQAKDISSIDSKGTFLDLSAKQRTDAIGWYIPAVPTKENDTFWGYTSVPQDGCEWWARLPTRP